MLTAETKRIEPTPAFKLLAIIKLLSDMVKGIITSVGFTVGLIIQIIFGRS